VSPRNSASAAAPCGCAAVNEAGSASEADFCATQFPLSLDLATGASSGVVYGQLYEAGVTEAAGGHALVRAQLGWGLPTSNPQYGSGFTWTNASFNAQQGNNDEYQASFNAPGTAGSYRYAYRFSLDEGVTWTVCDNNQGDFGAGSNAGLAFSFADLGVLTVTTP
jgi:hypothetical protein